MAVEEGLKATVAVKTTVIEPGKSPDGVVDGVDVLAVDDLVMELGTDARVLLLDAVDSKAVEPNAVVLNIFPVYWMVLPSCTEGVVWHPMSPT